MTRGVLWLLVLAGGAAQATDPPARSDDPPEAALHREAARLFILSATADPISERVVIRGGGFDEDTTHVALGGRWLTVLTSTPEEIVAALPSDVEPGTYRLVVWERHGRRRQVAIDLTVGSIGLPGPPGPAGPPGEPGPPGLLGSFDMLEGLSCVRGGAIGRIRIRYGADGTVTLTCDATVTNLPPLADAGPDQQVPSGAVVTLDGSASRDPEGQPLAYTWTQVAGPLVGALAGPRPAFLAPAGPTTLRFSLVVSDGVLTSAPDEVQVQVAPPTTGSSCGDGVRSGAEQCDDGNTRNLDGCDSTCRFEQSQRVTWLDLRNPTSTDGCASNALGGAVGSLALGSFNQWLFSGIRDGSTSILFTMPELLDLTGANASPLHLGILSGSPTAASAPGAYDGTSDLDWWYAAAPEFVDPQRRPNAVLEGSIVARLLNAGPGSARIRLSLNGRIVDLGMSNLGVRATIGGVSAPLATASGGPPGHLASEHLDPLLQTFANMGQASLTGSGRACGGISASSLAQAPIPSALLPGGEYFCNEEYAATNSLLDLFVGGCQVGVGGFSVVAVKPTQPDVVDPAAPPAGAGPPYVLSANPVLRQVTACRDRLGATVSLSTCLAAAAYSVEFRFATDRVIIR